MVVWTTVLHRANHSRDSLAGDKSAGRRTYDACDTAHTNNPLSH